MRAIVGTTKRYRRAEFGQHKVPCISAQLYSLNTIAPWGDLCRFCAKPQEGLSETAIARTVPSLASNEGAEVPRSSQSFPVIFVPRFSAIRVLRSEEDHASL